MKTIGVPFQLATVFAVLALAACGGAQDEAMSESPEAAAEPMEEAQSMTAELPEPTADAVWAYLQSQNYQEWEHWPGTTDRYPGGEPHGSTLTTYVDNVVMAALEAGTPVSVPAGGIIVKENYSPDGPLAAVTVMYKVPGFNPDHNDWWFLKRNADGTIDAEGRGPGCEGCHIREAANDYLMTALPGRP